METKMTYSGRALFILSASSCKNYTLKTGTPVEDGDSIFKGYVALFGKPPR